MSLPRKDAFHIPDGMIYLDGNSLGPLPRNVPQRVANMLENEWGTALIGGWNGCGWMAQPGHAGDRIGRLIGAPAGTVMVGDTLSIKVFQAVSAALQMRPERRVILSDNGNFPTDLYITEGLIALKNAGYQLKSVAPEEVEGALDDTVAALLLTQVDYRSGRRHDMAQLTRAAHNVGAVAIWDLAHSAGAIEVDLAASGCEFAVGCTYKYLNAGPGAPAFIYLRDDLTDQATPYLSGWLGHAAPFAFEHDYRPAPGIDKMRVGTPPVIQMAALEAALEIWDEVDMAALSAASRALSEQFIAEVAQRCPDLTLISPRDPDLRGSQVSFRFEHGYAAIQALIDKSVIGDFRAPDVMRFGITPLYLDHDDISQAVIRLAEVMDNRLWDSPAYQMRKAVT